MIRDSSPILSATEDALLRFGLTAFANLLLVVGHCDTRSPARFFMISLFGRPVQWNEFVSVRVSQSARRSIDKRGLDLCDKHKLSRTFPGRFFWMPLLGSASTSHFQFRLQLHKETSIREALTCPT